MGGDAQKVLPGRAGEKKKRLLSVGIDSYREVLWKIPAFTLILLSSAGIPLKVLWDDTYLVAWSSIILLYLPVSIYRYTSSKKTVEFIAAILITVNTAVQFGNQGIRFLYYPLAILSAIYFPRRINITALLIVIFLESANYYFSNPLTRNIIQHAGFSSSLAIISILTSFLFQKERKARDIAYKTLRELESKAEELDPFGGSEGEVVIKAISDDARFGHLVASGIQLEDDLRNMLHLIRKSLSAHTVCLFTPEKEGALGIRAFDSESEFILKNKRIEPGEGYVGWIWKERIPLNISEVKGGFGALGFYSGDMDVKSLMGAPLFDHGLFVGAIIADSKKISAFSKKEEELIEAFGNEVIKVLKKAKLDQQIDFSVRGLRTLNEISSKLSSTLNLKEIGEKLVELSNLIVPYDHGFILLYDEDKRVMELLASKNLNGIQTGARFPAERSLVGWIAQNHQALLFSKMKDSRDRIPILPETRIKARSFLGIPIGTNVEKVIGVFALLSDIPQAFSAHHQHLLSILCNQAAVSIMNAKLHLGMELMAITDGLTGLLNHRSFQEKLAGEFHRIERHAEPLSLVLADIDHFKKINDTYGHPTGDEVLKKVAGILKKMVRDIDVVARYGGEEFALILVNTERDGAFKSSERIRKEIAKKSFTCGGKKISVTLSLGIASYPKDGKIKQELISRADAALYQAKAEGRNRSCLFRK